MKGCGPRLIVARPMGTELRRNALRRQIGAEKVLTRLLMRRRSAAEAGNRSRAWAGPQRWPHINTPSAKWCLYGKFTTRALAYKMTQLEIMHPRWRIEFV